MNATPSPKVYCSSKCFQPLFKAQSSIFMNNSFLLFFFNSHIFIFVLFVKLFFIYLLIYWFRIKKEEFAAFTLILPRQKKIKSNSLEQCRIFWLVQSDCFKSDVNKSKNSAKLGTKENILTIDRNKKMLLFLHFFLVIIKRKEMNRREKF